MVLRSSTFARALLAIAGKSACNVSRAMSGTRVAFWSPVPNELSLFWIVTVRT
jgi:hypothetical protein